MPHFNFTVSELSGVVAVTTLEQASLLAMESVHAPIILSDRSAVIPVSERLPLPALTFADKLETSNLPAGKVNIIEDKRKELAPHFANPMDINVIADCANNPAVSSILQGRQAVNLKRHTSRRLTPAGWFTDRVENPYWILDTVEFKIAGHPISV